MAREYHWDHTVLPATHTRTKPSFTPHPQDVTALWLVLTVAIYDKDIKLIEGVK